VKAPDWGWEASSLDDSGWGPQSEDTVVWVGRLTPSVDGGMGRWIP
jgi:hypothetical protein